jgi:hypothetical protein
MQKIKTRLLKCHSLNISQEYCGSIGFSNAVGIINGTLIILPFYYQLFKGKICSYKFGLFSVHVFFSSG